MINKAILVGNLGRDPEMRYTQSGQPVANFSVATSERWTDRNSNERREQTEWHNVVCFSRLAEICGEYLHKGSKVYIEGRLQTRSWEGQDGQTRYRTEIVAREMKMLDSRGGGGSGYGPDDPGPADTRGNYGGQGQQPSRGPQPPRGDRQAPPPPADDPDDFEDDIPF
ncbi:MAG: single-stranded DNA-binding protein [Gammaproteobacteria bacterium]|nr:single-stranded DNA-binding protein [Gammaproteobacteria bacterium]